MIPRREEYSSNEGYRVKSNPKPANNFLFTASQKGLGRGQRSTIYWWRQSTYFPATLKCISLNCTPKKKNLYLYMCEYACIYEYGYTWKDAFPPRKEYSVTRLKAWSSHCYPEWPFLSLYLVEGALLSSHWHRLPWQTLQLHSVMFFCWILIITLSDLPEAAIKPLVKSQLTSWLWIISSFSSN